MKRIMAPKTLPKKYHPLYREIIDHLQEINLFDRTDRHLVNLFCEQVKLIDDARELLRNEGMIVPAAQGPKQHPACGIIDRASSQIAKLSMCMGLGGGVRKRLGIEQKREVENPWHTKQATKSGGKAKIQRM